MKTRSIISALIATAPLSLGSLAFAESDRTEEAPSAHCAAPFDDPRESPFAHREYIDGVQPYRVTRTQGQYMSTELEGATIKLRPAPGVTAEWLQRLINEHVARMASQPGGDMDWCPLALKGVRAEVASTGDGFAVTVKSTNARTAREVLRRAQALLATK